MALSQDNTKVEYAFTALAERALSLHKSEGMSDIATEL